MTCSQPHGVTHDHMGGTEVDPAATHMYRTKSAAAGYDNGYPVSVELLRVGEFRYAAIGRERGDPAAGAVISRYGAGMASTPPRGFIRIQWKLHKLLWSLSGGRVGRRVNGMPVLELVTIGHKSGQERSILIWYVDTASGPALIGTNAGAAYDPAWVKNLRANPGARMRRDGIWSDVTGRFPDGAEYDAIWGQATRAAEAYAGYEAILDRPIPIVVLEPS